MANVIVNAAKKKLLDGGIDMVNDDIRLVLLTSSHTPNIDTDEFWDDISANEVAASGSYTANGASLSSKTTVVDTTNDRAYFDADDVAFTSATITARYGGLIKWTGTASTSPIIGYYDYGADKTSTAGTFTHSFTAPASGGALYLG